MKRRGQGWWDFNQRKLANNRLVSLSDENLLKLMIRQRDSWVKAKSSGLLVIQTKEIFKKDILNKLQIFLKNNQLKYLPINYKTPKTTGRHMSESDLRLFKRYKILDRNVRVRYIT